MKNTHVSFLALMGTMLCLSQPVWSMEGEGEEKLAESQGKPKKITVKKTVKQQLIKKVASTKEAEKKARAELEEAVKNRETIEQQLMQKVAPTKEAEQKARAERGEAVKNRELLEARESLEAKEVIKEKSKLVKSMRQQNESNQRKLELFQYHEKCFKGDIKKFNVGNEQLKQRRDEAISGNPQVQYELGHDLIKAGELKVFYFRSELTEEEAQYTGLIKPYDVRQNKYGKTKKETEGYFWLETASNNGHKEAPWDIVTLFLQRKLEAAQNSREKAIDYMCQAALRGDFRAHCWYKEQKNYSTSVKFNLEHMYGFFILRQDELEKLGEAVEKWDKEAYSVNY